MESNNRLETIELLNQLTGMLNDAKTIPLFKLTMLKKEAVADMIPSGKVLVCHDEVFGKTLRDKGIKCDIATFFTLHDEIREEGDRKITEEDEFTELVRDGGYDVIVADEMLKPLASGFNGQWIDALFFALSGRR